jgi:hypothetical protein
MVTRAPEEDLCHDRRLGIGWGLQTASKRV